MSPSSCLYPGNDGIDGSVGKGVFGFPGKSFWKFILVKSQFPIFPIPTDKNYLTCAFFSVSVVKLFSKLSVVIFFTVILVASNHSVFIITFAVAL